MTDKRSTIYDKPMDKKCNHAETWEVWNVVDEATVTICRACGARNDKKKPPEA